MAEPAESQAISQIVERDERVQAAVASRVDPAALPGARRTGHSRMRTHHPRPGIRITIFKVVVFTVVSVLVTSIVISSLLDFNTHAASGLLTPSSRTRRVFSRATPSGSPESRSARSLR